MPESPRRPRLKQILATWWIYGVWFALLGAYALFAPVELAVTLPGFAIYLLLLTLAARLTVPEAGRSIWMGPPGLAIYEFHVPRLTCMLSWAPVAAFVLDEDEEILPVPTLTVNFVALAATLVATLAAISLTFHVAGVPQQAPRSATESLRLVEIMPGSALARAAAHSKVVAGDVIRCINGRPVAGLADAVRAVGGHGQLTLEVQSEQDLVQELRVSRKRDAHFGMVVGQWHPRDARWARVCQVDRHGVMASRGVGPGDYICLKDPEGDTADLDRWVERELETEVRLWHLPRRIPPERARNGQAREITLPPHRKSSGSSWTSHHMVRYHPTIAEAATLAVAAAVLHGISHADLHTWRDELTLWSALDLILLKLSWSVAWFSVWVIMFPILFVALRRWPRTWLWSTTRTIRVASLTGLLLWVALISLIIANQVPLELWVYQSWPALARVAWRLF